MDGEDLVLPSGIVMKRGLSSDELDAIWKLAEVCNGYEDIELKLNWDTLRSRPTTQVNDFLYYSDGRLVGFAGLYHFLADEAEVSGMVDPDFRRQGVFSKLIREAKAECRRRGVKSLIFIVQRGTATGKAFVGSTGAVYSFSEVVMELQGVPSSSHLIPELRLRAAREEDFHLLVDMNTRGFGMSKADACHYVRSSLGNPGELTLIAENGGIPVGKIGVIQERSEAFIVGFCVLPEYRRRGYGRHILTETVKQVGKEQKVGLEVNCTNERALQLYRSCGFVERNTNDYYVLQLGTGGRQLDD